MACVAAGDNDLLFRRGGEGLLIRESMCFTFVCVCSLWGLAATISLSCLSPVCIALTRLLSPLAISCISTLYPLLASAALGVWRCILILSIQSRRFLSSLDRQSGKLTQLGYSRNGHAAPHPCTSHPVLPLLISIEDPRDGDGCSEEKQETAIDINLWPVALPPVNSLGLLVYSFLPAALGAFAVPNTPDRYSTRLINRKPVAPMLPHVSAFQDPTSANASHPIAK